MPTRPLYDSNGRVSGHKTINKKKIKLKGLPKSEKFKDWPNGKFVLVPEALLTEFDGILQLIKEGDLIFISSRDDMFDLTHQLTIPLVKDVHQALKYYMTAKVLYIDQSQLKQRLRVDMHM